MSKLFRLKEWLTIHETSVYLTEVFKEPVTELDVLRFAKDRHLGISVLLVNPCIAKACQIIPTEQAKRVPSLDGTYEVILGYPISMTEVISTDGNLIKISGVYDLPMIRGEIDSIEAKFLEIANGPENTSIDVHGVYVGELRGNLFQLLCDFADTEEYKHMAEGKDVYDKDRYFPASRLPDDSMLVVRTKSIEKFKDYVTKSNSETINPQCFNKLPTEQRRKAVENYVDSAYLRGLSKTSAKKEGSVRVAC